GTADSNAQLDIDRFENTTDVNLNEPFWDVNYQGLFRANYLLAHLNDVEEWKDPNRKKIFEGEARTLRAHFDFDLSRIYGDIVLVNEPIKLGEEKLTAPRSPAKETYESIAEDLKFAIKNLPAVNYNGTKKFGRINKYIAEALMAKVFLFYTDKYNESDLAG